MQSRNVFCRPSVYRIAKSGIPTANRGLSMFAPTPCYPRFAGGPDFAPLFRLLDDFTSTRSPFDGFPTTLTHRPASQAQQQVYQPRFDVKEVEGGYELRGELPGVEPSNVEVAFTDEKTLTIKGRTERESTSGSPKAVTSTEPAAVENTDATHDNDDTGSEFSSTSYQKATVEDEEPAATAEDQPTTAKSSAVEAEAESSSAPAARAETEQPKESQARYWVSERSTGEFQRTFTFPARVNQDGVTASLKNGILNLRIPKAQVPAARRIAIE